MRVYECPACSGTVFFGNLGCMCGAALYFDVEGDAFRVDGLGCANRDAIGCNWSAPEAEALCASCALTETTPDLGHGANEELWGEAERGKRWALANLARWGWLLASDAGPRPTFRLLAEETRKGPANVVMGHAAGIVTINVVEARPSELVARQEALGERYRTMLGHFRHELAHFMFERLAERPDFPEAFRALFGDERADYGAALERYYADGPAVGWETDHVTKYASSHPHEDWAESFAHVMHLTDMLDSTLAIGLSGAGLPAPGYDAYAENDASAVIAQAGTVAIALNHLNRSMGLADAYPFVLNPVAAEKLAFVHGWLRGGPRRKR